MTRNKTLLLLALPLLLTSCFRNRESINDPINVAAVQSLKPGETTAKQCVERLGAPTEVIWLGKRTAYRYDYTVNKRAGLWLLILAFFNEDARQDRVYLFFDENNMLTHVGSTFHGHRPQYALPWEDLHEEEDNREADEERPELQQVGQGE